MQSTARRTELGTSLIEVLLAGAVLTIGVAGIAVCTVYQQSLEASTARLWASTCDATSQMEILRAAGESSWGTLKATHDGRTVETNMLYNMAAGDAAAADVTPGDYTISGDGTLTISDGRVYVAASYTLDGDGCPIVDGVRLQMQVANVADIAGNQLLVRVIDDAGAVSDGDLMWTPDATLPNFYAVDVSTATGEGEFSNRLRFQTYVADQTHLNHGATGSSSSSAGLPPGFEFPDYAAALSTTPAAVSVSGIDSEMLSFALTNQSAYSLSVTNVQVQLQSAGTFQEVLLAGVEVYSGTAVASIDDAQAVLLPAGEFQVRVNALPGSNGAEAPFDGGTVRLHVTFADGSSATVQVSP